MAPSTCARAAMVLAVSLAGILLTAGPAAAAHPAALAGPRRALLRTGKAVTSDAAGQSAGTIQGGSATANSAIRGGATSADNGAVKAGADHVWSFSKDPSGRRLRGLAQPAAGPHPRRALLRTGKAVTSDAAGRSAGAIQGGSATANSAIRGGAASADNGAVKAGADHVWSFSKDPSGRRLRGLAQPAAGPHPRRALLRTGKAVTSDAAQVSGGSVGSNTASANAALHDPSTSASNGGVSAKASLDWDANTDSSAAPRRGVGAQSLDGGSNVDWSQVAAQQGSGDGSNGGGAPSVVPSPNQNVATPSP